MADENCLEIIVVSEEHVADSLVENLKSLAKDPAYVPEGKGYRITATSDSSAVNSDLSERSRKSRPLPALVLIYLPEQMRSNILVEVKGVKKCVSRPSGASLCNLIKHVANVPILVATGEHFSEEKQALNKYPADKIIHGDSLVISPKNVAVESYRFLNDLYTKSAATSPPKQ